MPSSYAEWPDSQGPALVLLKKLGWTELSPEAALEMRGGSTSEVLLRPILEAQLRRLNPIEYKGRTYELSAGNAHEAAEKLRRLPEASLIQANERAYGPAHARDERRARGRGRPEEPPGPLRRLGRARRPARPERVPRRPRVRGPARRRRPLPARPRPVRQRHPASGRREQAARQERVRRGRHPPDAPQPEAERHPAPVLHGPTPALGPAQRRPVRDRRDGGEVLVGLEGRRGRGGCSSAGPGPRAGHVRAARARPRALVTSCARTGSWSSRGCSSCSTPASRKWPATSSTSRSGRRWRGSDGATSTADARAA